MMNKLEFWQAVYTAAVIGRSTPSGGGSFSFSTASAVDTAKHANAVADIAAKDFDTASKELAP